MQPPPVGFCTVCSMRSRVMHSARVRVTHNNSAESCMYDRLHNFNLIKPDNSRALSNGSSVGGLCRERWMWQVKRIRSCL